MKVKKEIIINHTEHEVRLALMENGQISEIFHEREKDKGVVGNIYKGKVLKVLPGMESAFVDIGLEKAAFLFVDDIRTDKSDYDVGNGDVEIKSDSDGNTEKNKKPTISQLIREGEDILVQVSKGPIGTKGARITCNISLPGRNLVLMPHMNNVGVSRQIYDEKERTRLRQIVSRIKPADFGFIVRTVGTKRSEEEFKHELWAYRKFRKFRDGAEQRPWTKVAASRLPERLEAMRKKLRADVVARRARDEASGRIGF